METRQQQAAIEAILFASGEPVPVSRLALALELDEDEIRYLTEGLMERYARQQGGVTLRRLDDAYQLCSQPDYAPYVRKAMDLRRNTPLSQAAMEVLAVVAYNQPVTKAFIEQVRGVDCSAVLQGLITKGLVEERGRLELPGRPLLYGTTPHFLLSFGMTSLQDLPPLPEKEEAGLPGMDGALDGQVTLGDLVEPQEEETPPDEDAEETV
ncbi:MAG: SMC-Scp complex subunit ScpB [Acutalibacteraceae bacterium]|jgi:segregation and condensation protein B